MSYPISPQAFQKHIIRTALGGITEIRPLIHRSKFFIEKCSYGEVEERLGKIRILSREIKADSTLDVNQAIGKSALFPRGLGVLTVFFNPKGSLVALVPVSYFPIESSSPDGPCTTTCQVTLI